MKIPSCVKPENRYDLAFKLEPPKFPKLSSADFGLAFYPPYPDWFVCGNYHNCLKQESKKPAERVVLTKHTLDSFKGFLHFDINQVLILSPESEGVEPNDLLIPLILFIIFFLTDTNMYCLVISF